MSTDKPRQDGITAQVPVKFRDLGDGTFAVVVATQDALYDSAGNALPANFNGLPQALTYNSDGTLATVTVTNGPSTWVQTMSYTSGNLTGVSAWVKQ